jgi:cell division transport system permease protein
VKGIPTHKPNYSYAILSVTMVLFLLGLFGLLLLQGQQYVRMLKEQVEWMVELKPDRTVAAQDSLQGFLTASAFLKPGSDRFVSKEAGMALMRSEFGEDFLKLDMANPLYDVIVFRLKADWMEATKLRFVRETLRGFTAVSDVYYQDHVADAIAANLRKIGMGVLVAGLVLLFVSVALILNTIRLALYANRHLIKNMELVGASWGFISRPYLLRSIWQGLFSGLLAIGVLTGLLRLALQYAEGLREWFDLERTLYVFAALLAFGILLNLTGTYYVVRKYLKMRVDDLY